MYDTYDRLYLYLHSYISILFVVKVISWRSFVGELLASPTAPPPCFHGAPVAMSRSPPFFILRCLLMISRSGTNKSTLAEPPDTPQHSTQPARERAGTFSTRLLVAISLVYICCCRRCVVASSPRSVLWRVCFRGCLKKQPAKYK